MRCHPVLPIGLHLFSFIGKLIPLTLEVVLYLASSLVATPLDSF
jgi:hypothetical protein